MSATPDLDALTARAEQRLDQFGAVLFPDIAVLIRDLLTYATTVTRRRDEIAQGLADIQRHRDAWRRYAYTGESKPSDFLDGNQVDRTQTFIEDLRDQVATLTAERDALRETIVEYSRAKAAWVSEETDATAHRLGKAEHALDAIAERITP